MRTAARAAATALLAIGIMLAGGAPAAAQDPGPAEQWPAEQKLAELQAELDACAALAENPAPANRADKDTLEQWSACAELENDASPPMLDRDHELFGSSAVTSEGFPLGAYRMHYSTAGFFGISRKAMGMWMEFTWLAGITTSRMAVWSFDWVVNGRVTDLLTGIPEGIRDALLDSGLLGGLLGPMAILVSSAAGILAIIKRRTAQGVSHLVWLMLVIGLGTLLVANADIYYDGVREARNELSDAVVDSSGLNTDVNGKLDAGKLMAPLMSAVVHEPWELLNWGIRLETQDCIDKATAVLTRGAGSSSDWPRRTMRGCPDANNAATRHAHNPTPTRMIGVGISAATQIMIGLFIMSLAILALGSEVLLAGAFAVLPAAVVLAAFPGGRRIAASWLSFLIQGLIGLAFGIVSLRITEIVFVGIANSPAARTMPLMSVLLVLAAVAFVGFRYRKRLPEAGRALSQRLGGTVASAGSGGGGGGGGAALAGAAGAAGGLLGGLALAQSAGPPGGGAALATAARTARKAGQGAVAKGTAVAQAAAPNSKATKLLSNTKAAGGAGVGMAATLAAAQRFPGGARRSAAHAAQQRGGVSKNRADELIGKRRSKHKLRAVNSQHASPEVLAQGAASRSRAVREAVAAHPNTPESIRSDMAEKTRRGQIKRNLANGAYGPLSGHSDPAAAAIGTNGDIASASPVHPAAGQNPAASHSVTPPSPWDPPAAEPVDA